MFVFSHYTNMLQIIPSYKKKNVNLISFFYITDVKEWDKQNLSSSAIPQAFYTTCRWERSSEMHELYSDITFTRLQMNNNLVSKLLCMYIYLFLADPFLLKD